MNATTSARTSRADSTNDAPTDIHGDVDINGDLVDELTLRLGTPSMREMARERRLASAIDAGPLAAAQLAAVKRLLHGVPA